MVDIEDYTSSYGVVDYDAYTAAVRKEKEVNCGRALASFTEAQKLAKVNGLDLVQHSPWHFSLTCIEDGKRQWRANLYPSNQRIWVDKKCGKIFLDVSKPWNFLDVVSAAIIKTQIPPKELLDQLC